ncbi:hypothetical protein PPYR_07088 [Photinus pyralis]|uniref:Uncharacterized protein n=2 Tax=Photinus pyralis TaxID=7054 RepID=A0A5N4APS1_PHOPY|nr:uncharacterized protein C1orf131 homolog [Photinus pyralis]KAB0799208.1 hypothetical protein PPYR_07088 [Photinus pyralis]
MQNSLDFIPTKSSIINSNCNKDFESVTFTSYKKKQKQTSSSSSPTTKNEKSNVFDIKKARYEVLKFGISGLDHNKKQEAQIRLAIKLGAKPPKNKYKNYKELLEERKKEKEVNDSNLRFQQLGKDEQGKSLVKIKKSKRRKNVLKGSLLEAYGTTKVKSKK